MFRDIEPYREAGRNHQFLVILLTIGGYVGLYNALISKFYLSVTILIVLITIPLSFVLSELLLWLIYRWTIYRIWNRGDSE